MEELFILILKKYLQDDDKLMCKPCEIEYFKIKYYNKKKNNCKEQLVCYDGLIIYFFKL